MESLSPLAGLFAERPVTTNPFPTEHAPLSLKRETPGQARAFALKQVDPKRPWNGQDSAVCRVVQSGRRSKTSGPVAVDPQAITRLPVARGIRPEYAQSATAGGVGGVGGEAEGRAVRVGDVERVRGARGRRRRAALLCALWLLVARRNVKKRWRESERERTA